tara:strand:+ start:457 stop:651 length:195 start_codon:yes stop_codon:yes gene_type:complete
MEAPLLADGPDELPQAFRHGSQKDIKGDIDYEQQIHFDIPEAGKSSTSISADHLFDFKDCDCCE